MSTASFTWTNWDATNAWEDLADAGNNANLAYARDASGVAKFTSGTKGATMTEYGRKSGAGNTFASIFGIDASNTITAIQCTAWQSGMWENTKFSSHSVTLKMINDAGAAQATLLDAVTPDSTNDDTMHNMSAGSNQTGLSISAGDNTRLSLEYTVTTSGGGGSALIDERFDNVQVTITYSPAPQSLAGTAASTAFAVVAAAIVAGAVALSGATAWSTSTLPNQSLQSTTAISGSAASFAWVVPEQSIELEAAAQELTGDVPSSTAVVPTQHLYPWTTWGASWGASWGTSWQRSATGTQSLSGNVASAAWAIPSQGLSPGVVAIAGASPIAAWNIPAQALVAAGITLSGDPAAVAWLVPSQSIVVGSVALSGGVAFAAWAAPPQSLSGAGQLIGDAPSSSWVLPSQVIAAGSLSISGTVCAAVWYVPQQSISAGEVGTISKRSSKWRRSSSV